MIQCSQIEPATWSSWLEARGMPHPSSSGLGAPTYLSGHSPLLHIAPIVRRPIYTSVYTRPAWSYPDPEPGQGPVAKL